MERDRHLVSKQLASVFDIILYSGIGAYVYANEYIYMCLDNYHNLYLLTIFFHVPILLTILDWRLKNPFPRQLDH